MAKRDRSERLLLAGVDRIETELARNLLQSAGIPVRLEGGHSPLALIGYDVTQWTSSPDLYVPAPLFERAREVLREAWDPDALDDRLALETPAAAEPEPRSRTRGVIVALVVLAALVAILYFGDYFSPRPG